MLDLPQVPNLAEAPYDADTEGCIQCQMGSKLVLFVTGNCHWQCDYCPLSESRRDIDWMFANERRCETFDEVIEEARAMRATGAGITGGDPLMARERTLEGIARLKAEFGPAFHLHMYTSIPFRPEWASEFAEAGLDEIRFHLLDLEAEGYRETIASCSGAGILTGVEIPCEPDREDDLLELLETLRDLEVSFLNLNELEITVGNHHNMELRGFNLSTEITAGAAGSAELAIAMRDRVMAAERGEPDPNDGEMREAYGYHLKFCTAVYKDAGQLRRRFLRRGEATIAPHEVLTDDGTLLFGAIGASEDTQEAWMSELVSVTGLPQRFLLWDEANGRIEMPLVVAESIAADVDAPVSMVEVLPTHERLEVTVVWLNAQGG
ncbi:MAG: radical SAM protein [Candidatus Thermoplasmatota archaeon]|uniref:Radical SAM domain-containing protein n=1 Tax=uncultured marine group II/III euryarchaeote AD1000_72_D09 TaxID=1457805 RepID=A0A075FY05_9EURY|nr:radical SAM domain-containing protein [uncultured marine group II/III euryarchaeote AD1000_72_D09]MEE2650415.1 radical SAM protein [Candidatus Thermoplasmatota archaeon]